ncbi:hypothetical protein BGZ68_002752 [Mortierella alpina]|nr:hypothetical protein BGZ68_002752 [Mortierella alpina]
MDYLVVAAGAGAGVYYMLSKVVEPIQQAKRASEAERARQELLLLEEERLLKRGPNRQAKKKPVSAAHLKQDDPNNADNTSEHLSENIPTSNPYNLLEGNGTDPSPSHSRTRSEVKRMILSSSSKTVSVSSKTVVSSTERRSIIKSGVDRVHAEGQSAVSSESSSSSSSSSFQVLRDVARNAQLVATLDGDKAKVVQDLEIQLPQTPQYEFSESVATPDYFMLSQEVQALQAILKARELALTASDARTESAQRKIQDLQQQLEADQKIVQAAKKSEARAQKQAEKLDSLSYTNTLLVNQLTLERESWKAAAAAAAQNQGQGHLAPEQLPALPCEICAQKAQDLKDAQNRAEAALQERNDLQSQMSKLLKDKDTNIEELVAEIENQNKQIEAYKEALEHVEAVAQTGKENIEAEKRVLVEELNRLQEELNRLKDGHAEEARNIEVKLDEMEKRENELRAQLSTTEALLETTRSTVADQDIELSRAKKRMSNLRSELEVTQTEKASLLEKLREMEDDLEALVLEKEELSHKLNDLQKAQPLKTKAETKVIRDEVEKEEKAPFIVQETVEEEEETTVDEVQDRIEEVQLSLEVQHALDSGFGGERGLVAAC